MPNEIYASSLRDKSLKPVIKADALAGVWNGWLLFIRNGAIYAQRFDQKKLAVNGDPRKIVDGATYVEASASAFASVSTDGALFYPPFHATKYDFSWYDEGGHLLQKAFESEGGASLAISPDDAKIAMAIFDPRKGADDVYVRDLARGVVTRVTGGLSNHTNVLWSPDASRVYFSTDREGMYDIFSQTDDGTSPAQPVWKGGDDKYTATVSPDAKAMIAWLYSAKTKADLWIVPLDGGAPRQWITTDGGEYSAHFSPDGKWITYASDRSGRSESYIAAYPDGRSYQISTEGGGGQEWNHDGSRVFFQNNSTVYAVDVKRDGKTATVGKPVALFTMSPMTLGWWCSHTSNKVLLRTVIDPRQTVDVVNYVKGWADALK